MEEQFIEIKGARVNNLKNINVTIPRNQLVVITGVSGSGKSSLAFDTLYAEGQRRYMESLSAYARQFLGRISKPDVDMITGISPSIAIRQKVYNSNQRSTVGTSTEIYEYLKLLFARLGKTYSPVSGREVMHYTLDDIINVIVKSPENTRYYICFTQKTDSETVVSQLNTFIEQGYSRIVMKQNDEMTLMQLQNVITQQDIIKQIAGEKQIVVLVDRIVVHEGMENLSGDSLQHLSDSVETALYEGSGYCLLIDVTDKNNPKSESYSNKFEADGLSFEEPSPNLFSFNNPYGACPACNGLGSIIGIDEDLVIPDKNLSVYEGAVACWKGEKMQEWKNALIANAARCDFPIHTPINQLTEKEYEMLWEGTPYFHGIKDFFDYIEAHIFKIQYRVMKSRFQGKTKCPDCKGKRLRKEALYVRFRGKTITELSDMQIGDLRDFFNNVQLTEQENSVAERVLNEIRQRLDFLYEVGLHYITLNRSSSTLSGGESQRINLATSLGSNLTNSMYILDEPSVGLHHQDVARLIKMLRKLRDLGNTVIVVEHDEDIMRAADYIVDIGPLAGRLGGEVVFQGTIDKMLQADTLTAKYLRGDLKIQLPVNHRKVKDFITLKGASQFNLKNIDVDFPLNMITVVTGVSGSGKTTLIDGILYPALKRQLTETTLKPGKYKSLSGDIMALSDVDLVDQNPIGRSTRSNSVTYIGAYDDIRTLFAQQKLSVTRGYKPTTFSFNTKGGRCETCQGDGYITIEMQFLADVTLVCDECGGKRFKPEILEVKYKGYSIYDILEMTINQAVELFSAGDTPLEQNINKKLVPLQNVGLGYLKMGQSTSTLSGGEAQRIKLASYLLDNDSSQHKLLIFDEPTTGLHFHDISKLMTSFNSLVEKGNSIIVIEHNKEVIRCADYIIELGPEGGENGGYVMSAGPNNDI